MTFINSDRFPVYSRDEADEWIVPHNAALLLKFRCHLNVEIAAYGSVKYLTKYITKGAARTTAHVYKMQSRGSCEPVRQLLRCRRYTNAVCMHAAHKSPLHLYHDQAYLTSRANYQS